MLNIRVFQLYDDSTNYIIRDKKGQQCCLLRLCIHSIQESTLKELISFRGKFGGKYWVKLCEYFTLLF